MTLTGGPNAGRSAPVPFIVRQDPAAEPSGMLVVSSSNTEQAYNSWGGKSVYGFSCDDQYEFEFALDILLDGFECLRQRAWTSGKAGGLA